MPSPSIGIAFSLVLLPTLIRAAEVPELVPPRMHSGFVNSLVADPLGRFYITGGDDGTIRIWDLPGSHHLRTISTPAKITSLALNSTKKEVLAASVVRFQEFSDRETGTSSLQIYNLGSGLPIGPPIKGIGFVSDMVWSSTNRVAIRSISTNTLTVLDLGTSKVLWSAPSYYFGKDFAPTLAFSKDEKVLFCASIRGVRSFDVETGKLLRDYGGQHKSSTQSVALAEDRGIIATGESDGTVLFWGLNDGIEKLPPLKLPSPIYALSLSSNPRFLYVAYAPEHTIRTSGNPAGMTKFDLGSGTVVATVKNERDLELEQFDKLAVSGDFVITGWAGGFTIWDATALTVVSRMAGSSYALVGHFTPEGHLLFWQTRTDRVLEPQSTGISVTTLQGIDDDIASGDFVIEGKYLLTPTDTLDEKLGIFDLTGSDPPRYVKPTSDLYTATIAPGGNAIAIAESLLGGVVRLSLYNLKESRETWAVNIAYKAEGNSPTRYATAMVFSKDGQHLFLGGSDGTVRKIDAAYGRGETVDTWATNVSNGYVASLAVSPDDELVVATTWQLNSDANGEVKILTWDARTGVLLGQGRFASEDEIRLALTTTTMVFGFGTRVLAQSILLDHNSVDIAVTDTPIRTLSVSGDGRFVAIGTEESLSLWSIEERRKLATVIATSPSGPESGWVVFTPEGLFEASSHLWDSVRWRIDADTFKTIGVSAYARQNFVPGLISRVLSGVETPAAAVPKASDISQLRLDLKALNKAGSALTVRIKVHSARAGQRAKDMRLFHDGRLIKSWPGEIVLIDGMLTTEFTLSLHSGMNTLWAYVFDENGLSSDRSRLEVKEPIFRIDKSKLHVLAVGVTNYQDPKLTLRFPAADAELMIDELQNVQKQSFAYNSIRTTLLRNQEATRDAVLKAIDSVAREAGPTDDVIIFFAGHGQQAGQRYMFLPFDAKMQDGRAVSESAITDQELANALSPLVAANAALILDTCDSGQVLKTSTDYRQGPLNATGFSQIAWETGLAVLAAAQSEQQSLEDNKYGHGLLTHALVIEELRNKRMLLDDGAIIIDWDEWLRSAIRRMKELQPEGIQVPAAFIPERLARTRAWGFLPLKPKLNGPFKEMPLISELRMKDRPVLILSFVQGDSPWHPIYAEELRRSEKSNPGIQGIVVRFPYFRDAFLDKPSEQRRSSDKYTAIVDDTSEADLCKHYLVCLISIDKYFMPQYVMLDNNGKVLGRVLGGLDADRLDAWITDCVRPLSLPADGR